MNQRSLLLTLLCAPWLQLCAQGYIPRWERNPVEIELGKMNRDPDLKNASVSFVCIDTAGNKVIAEMNPDMSLVPASTMKLVTTATALEVLGPKKRFVTTIQHDGYIDTSCVLHGNVYIKGGGDPGLGSDMFKYIYEHPPFLVAWADAIVQLGIDSIDGRVIGDATIFSENMTPSTWIWGDMGQYYGTGPSGLTYKDNTCLIQFESGSKEGEFTTIKCVYPYVPGLDFENKVQSSSVRKDEAYIYGAPYTDDRQVVGTIPSDRDNFWVRASLPDPPYVAAIELESQLYEIGVPQRLPATTVRRLKKNREYMETKRTDVYSTWSARVSEIVDLTNTYSNNLFAEHLLNHVALNRYGHGETISGTMAVYNFWKKKEVDVEGLYMFDGSGLSRFNAISANHLTGMLRYMLESSNYETFYNSLPVAGKSGTLKNMCKHTAAQNNLRAKSGTLNRVKSYAGYVTSKDGKQLVFAMIVNNFSCSPFDMRRKMEKVMVAMAEYKAQSTPEQSKGPSRKRR